MGKRMILLSIVIAFSCERIQANEEAYDIGVNLDQIVIKAVETRGQFDLLQQREGDQISPEEWVPILNGYVTLDKFIDHAMEDLIRGLFSSPGNFAMENGESELPAYLCYDIGVRQSSISQKREWYKKLFQTGDGDDTELYYSALAWIDLARAYGLENDMRQYWNYLEQALKSIHEYKMNKGTNNSGYWEALRQVKEITVDFLRGSRTDWTEWYSTLEKDRQALFDRYEVTAELKRGRFEERLPKRYVSGWEALDSKTERRYIRYLEEGYDLPKQIKPWIELLQRGNEPTTETATSH